MPVAQVLLNHFGLRKQAVSAQTDRKLCDSAEGSVKFEINQKKKTEQEEEKQYRLYEQQQKRSVHARVR